MSEIQTLFKKVDYTLSGLLHYIDNGDIGLPDIQRPFVWKPVKVRDLFDSMYRGFPVGYLLFWQNPGGNGVRPIGVDSKAHSAPALLIVDGQQRLTSLYSVFRGKPVVDDNYRERRIEIAFRPRDGKFGVGDAAIRKDPEFIPDISTLWASGKTSWSLVNDFLNRLGTSRSLSEDEKERISANLDRLFDIQKYPFTALEIASAVDEEEVADIFVRINSEGVELNQADFILTLLSVFGEDIRVRFEQFCRLCRTVPKPGGGPSPFNRFIEPSPDQMLRVAIAHGFSRARLRGVYQILRGKDPVTERFEPKLREAQFEVLRESQAQALDLGHWHAFLNALVGAGYRSSEMVSSQNSLLFAYAFYVIGRTRHQIPHHVLDKATGRWFYAVTLTGRYTSSPETGMEVDLNLIKALPDGESFVAALSRIMAETLTPDFWTITLPNQLAYSTGRSPWLYAYYAALNVLHAPVLFSHKTVPDLFDPALAAPKKALERHHLFPRARLESQGIGEMTLINQIANFALLEWPDNVGISGASPADYLPTMRERFSENEWREMCRLHALPDGWERMDYQDFLTKRRALMAGITREGYEALS